MLLQEQELHQEIDKIYTRRNVHNWTAAKLINKHSDFAEQYPSIFNSLLDNTIDINRVHQIVGMYHHAKKNNTLESTTKQLHKELATEYLFPVLSEEEQKQVLEGIDKETR